MFWHAVLASPYALELLWRRFAALTNTANNGASRCVAVANAHAVLASPFALELLWRRFAALADTATMKEHVKLNTIDDDIRIMMI